VKRRMTAETRWTRSSKSLKTSTTFFFPKPSSSTWDSTKISTCLVWTEKAARVVLTTTTQMMMARKRIPKIRMMPPLTERSKSASNND
jgi:hypothetical protein